MRIGLCHKRLDQKGGTEGDFYRTAVGLRDLGHDIHLFCSEFNVAPPMGTNPHRVPIIRLGRTARLWTFAAFAPWIMRRFACERVINFGRLFSQDVLRCGGGTHRGFLSRIGAKEGRGRHLWQTISLYHQSLLFLEKRQFSAGHFKMVIAVSEGVKRELIDTYAVPEKEIVVLYNGVDHDRFHPHLRAKWYGSIRRQWGVPLDAPMVLFVGSGFRRKGLDRLIGVWNSTRLGSSFLLVVGDDPRLGSFRKRAEIVANGRIIFTGRQPEVEKYYAAADVVVLPSVQEAFGNVVLEALASGLPVVTTREVGAAEVLAGMFRDGIVQEPDNRDEIETRLLAMMDRSREPSTRIEARKLGEKYSWKHYFRRLEACLLSLEEHSDSGFSP